MSKKQNRMEYMFILPGRCGGGAERVVSVLSSALAERGYRTCIMQFERSERDYPVSDAVTIHYLDEDGDVKNVRRAKRRFLRKWVKAYRPRFVLPFLGSTLFYAFLATRFTSSRFIGTVRNNPDRSVSGKKEKLLRNTIFRLSRGVMTQTSGQRDLLPRGIRKKCFVLANPVNQLFLDAAYEVRDKVAHIVAAGRLVPQKNYLLLLRAFEKVHQAHPDVVLDIYGEGREEENIRTLISELSLADAVVLHGRTMDMIAALSEADLYVMSSDFEGFPNALMEAMAMGIPAISTDCPTGPSDLIESGKTGELVPVGDADAMAEAMLRMIEDTPYRRSCGTSARRAVEENYQTEHIVSEFVQKLKSL